MSTLTGTAPLVRHALRRDRLLATTWVGVLALTCYASAAATAGLYPTEEERVAAAQAIDASPAIVALYGPILDVHSLGELAMTKMTVTYAVFVAVMCVVLVRRHTRVEEESGQTELLGGTAVGRDAPLAAAVLEAAGVVVVLGLLAAGVNVAAGLPVAGSVAFGASWAGVGLVAAALTAVACQVSASARTCAAYAAAGVGVLYLLRAVGDTTVGWLSWTSPLGWSTQLRAYGGTRWWVLLLYVVLSAALVAVAQLLRAHRDLGSGLVAAEAGAGRGVTAAGGRRRAEPAGARPAAGDLERGLRRDGGGARRHRPQIGDAARLRRRARMMERLGGVGVLEDTLVAARASVSWRSSSAASRSRSWATAPSTRTTAGPSRCWPPPPRAPTPSWRRSLVALVGATWLLLVTGVAVERRATASRLDASVTGLVGPLPWPRPRPSGWWPRSPCSPSRSAAAGPCSAGCSWSCS